MPSRPDTRHLHPPVEPYEQGMLDVGDGNRVHWEVCGNPDGKPALLVHGGPGSGSGTVAQRRFDPERYKIVTFDQRGCGRSTPSAADPATDMRHNTTAHLVADMELLRQHLGIARWLLFGGSWGSTLILAYAERHPERVSQIVIPAVTTTRRYEIEWLYRGAGRIFPEERHRFHAHVPEADPDADLPGVLAAYARRMADPDPAVRAAAADAWCRWEDAVLSMEAPGDAPKTYGDRPREARHALVRICAHYFAHGAWLEEGALLRDAGRLAGIPGVLVHGRFDLGGPLDTAWELSRAWPDARLVVVEDAGHLGSETTSAEIRAALDEFASR
ncbi:prolyl aminopeptidase [Streptomyces nanshensis]|uniref:Proline iminopeptidase n=1 Tax=Streptomyces nanshensis TaxID=518642 RepID=A0A1E7L918_9ACTN|nr:prolyl aminopeptidase [Streptomyces nanshensis]OEV12722.1 proline iminopeptidase [Streptomyces nanshensis]